jgi:hypothetical protein
MLKVNFFRFLLILGLSLPAIAAQQSNPVIIKGKVLAESTGKPITDAHVFVLDGEEEALTNQRGEFIIKSWQKPPYKITVEKPGHYHKASIVVSDVSGKTVIRLKTW